MTAHVSQCGVGCGKQVGMHVHAHVHACLRATTKQASRRRNHQARIPYACLLATTHTHACMQTQIYTDIHPKKIILSNKYTFDLSLNTITFRNNDISLQYPLNTNDYELNNIYIEKFM